jgi:diguanylate cyclase (GGDEF)-like protein/PAS domain S-box-containing protein
VQANASLAAMLGATPAELAGRGAATLIDPSERENAHAHLQGLSCGEPCSSPVELTLRAGAGEPLCVSVHGAMIAGADGAPEHLVLQLQDITERKSLELELRRSAERGMSRELTRAMADHQRYGTPATLLACDLDNLKPVNDTLGHQAGDELLTGVAQTLSEQVRDTDVVARMGGDEFLVLLAHTGPRQAGAMAQRLQTAVRTLTPKGMPPTSISVGMAALGDGLSAEDAVIAADLAMYEAKRQGPSRMGVSRPIPRARDHDDSTCTIGRQ